MAGIIGELIIALKKCNNPDLVYLELLYEIINMAIGIALFWEY